MDLLQKTLALEHEASNFGFCWENTTQIMAQILSECQEVSEHLNQDATPDNTLLLQEELGDLLHAVFSLCVFCKLNPKDTLEKTLTKFERRLNAVKKLSHQMGFTTLKGQSFDELMQVWDKAKQLVG